MAKIHINNPKQVINGGAKKYYFKVKGLGGPKGDKGDKGDTGATGPQGPQGNAATVSIGSTTTLPVGYDATVTNTGSIYNAVLNFGIPQGPRGPQGATGATGAKGDKGDQGNPGPQGEKGTNATVYVGTTSTLNPGSQATVYNSGTDSNAVLNFGIPKGEKGDTGPMPTIAQTTGQAIDQVMSQKATTDALNTKQATITSSNKLSADLVDDTSTTNKFVTASDITNWNGKQDALTAGTGIDITGGVISTPAIVPEVVTELPTTGAEGKLYLTPKAHTTKTATGNPIEATITEQAGQLESFQLDGDTYQQSYTGKNLYRSENKTTTWDGASVTTDGSEITFTGNSSGNSSMSYNRQEIAISIPSGTSLTISAKTVSSSAWDSGVLRVGVRLHYSDDTTSNLYIPDYYPSDFGTTKSTTITTNKDIVGMLPAGLSYSAKGVSTAVTFVCQFEVGSTETTYEPYVGGQPSPNPSYPQQIQTVTGTQTISINGTNYPISLGSLELCKLGTYQDYIFKDGEDWKIRKYTRRIDTDSSTSVITGAFGTNSYQIGLPDGRQVNDSIRVISDYFEGKSYNDRTAIQNNFVYMDYDQSPWAYIRNTSWASISAFQTWLGQNKPKFYYAATPTNITITDTDLIAQLEAIRTASLQNGANTITNTATGSNLAGDMEIGYFEFNPTNRYDKFIWLNLDNNYEQIGGE